MQVYVNGGNGIMMSAIKMFAEIQQHELNVSITGIPKTVYNDIRIIVGSLVSKPLWRWHSRQSV